MPAPPGQYLKYVDVKLTDSNHPPVGALTVPVGDWVFDLNRGFGGKFAWIVPVWTANRDEAIRTIKFIRSPHALTTWTDTSGPTPIQRPVNTVDFANGTGGDYRYILGSNSIPPSDPDCPITGIMLAFSSGAQKTGAAGMTLKPGDGPQTDLANTFQECLANFYQGPDLNQGRGGGYLYLCWSYANKPAPRFLKGLDVRLTDSTDIPDDALHIYGDASSDLNRNFGGKYAYLIPTWTTNPDEAVRQITFTHSDSAIPSLGTDFATDTGGQFRYITTSTAPTQPDSRILDVRLVRSDGARSNFSDTFGKSWEAYYQGPDLNVDRGKSYLYLCWSRE